MDRLIDIIYRVFNIKINRKLYERDLYYFLHRFHVGITYGIIILPLGLSIFLFPELTFFKWIFASVGLLTFLFIAYRKLTHLKGDDLDFLYKKRFYLATTRLSSGIIVILIILVNLDIDQIEIALTMPFWKITQLFFLSLLLVFFNSIYMLRTAFKNAS